VNLHDRYPMESSHVPGRLDSRHVGQFQEPARRYAQAETPLLGLACLEVGERFPSDGVHENIAGMAVELFDSPAKLPAEAFELGDVHDGQNRGTRPSESENGANRKQGRSTLLGMKTMRSRALCLKVYSDASFAFESVVEFDQLLPQLFRRFCRYTTATTAGDLP